MGWRYQQGSLLEDTLANLWNPHPLLTLGLPQIIKILEAEATLGGLSFFKELLKNLVDRKLSCDSIQHGINCIFSK